MFVCLGRGADCLHMVQLMPLHPKPQSSLALFKSRMVLPFSYRITQVVLEKWPFNGCSCMLCCFGAINNNINSRGSMSMVAFGLQLITSYHLSVFHSGTGS